MEYSEAEERVEAEMPEALEARDRLWAAIEPYPLHIQIPVLGAQIATLLADQDNPRKAALKFIKTLCQNLLGEMD